MCKGKKNFTITLAAILSIVVPLNAVLTAASTFQNQGQLISVGIVGFSDESGSGASAELCRMTSQDLRTQFAAAYKDILPRIVNSDGGSPNELNLEQMTAIGKRQGVRFVIRGGFLSVVSEHQRIVVQLYAEVVSVESGKVLSVRSEGTGSLHGTTTIDWRSIDDKKSGLGQALSAAIQSLATSIHQSLNSDAAASAENPVEPTQTPTEPQPDQAEITTQSDDELRQLLAQAETFIAGDAAANSGSLEALQQALKNLNNALATKASLIEKGEDTTPADQEIALRREELQTALSTVTDQASDGETVVGDSQHSSEKKNLLGRLGEYATEALNILQKVHEMKALVRGSEQSYPDQGITGELPGEPTEEATADITGVVTDGGVPVEGASVMESASGLTTLTDETGSYTLNGVVGSLANIVVAKAGKQLATGKIDLQHSGPSVADFDVKAASKSASPRIIPSTVVLKAGNVKGGVVKGQVLDPQGKPAAFALVTLKGLGNARSDAAGRYTFVNVPAGTHQLTAQRIGLASKVKPVLVTPQKTSETQIRFTSADKITSALTKTPIVVRTSPASARGVVTDEQKRPIAGAKATVFLGTSAVSVISGRDGAYELRSLAPGEYRILISKAGFESKSRKLSLRVAEVLSLDFQLKRSSDPLAVIVAKRVSTNQTRSSVQPVQTENTGQLIGHILDQATQRPISNVHVSLSGGAISRTDANGNYTLSKIMPGRHVVSVTKAGYAEQKRSVVIRNGVTRQDISLSRERLTTSLAVPQVNGRLLGQIVDAGTGKPISGVTVSLPNKRSFTTNQSGAFNFENLPAGSYEVIVRRSGYADGTRTVTVRAGQSVTLNFRLVGRSAIQLRRTAVPR
jgi:5-hydroxyisourate hydrolase-like protein (transthyretin family)